MGLADYAEVTWISGIIAVFRPELKNPSLHNRGRGPYFGTKVSLDIPIRSKRCAILSLSRAQVTNRTGYIPEVRPS